MIKFSVLLPTRNRLKYLEYAVETVIRQDYEDWEIIISDNCSDEDIEGFVSSLNDPRVQYTRVDEFISATDNWNHALDRSTGDYVIMLGDDDGLMKGYFRTASRLIEEHSAPELIHTNGYLFAYPGALPDPPTGYTATWTYDIFEANAPYLLDERKALELVEKTFNFEVGFGWNMQFSLVKRDLIEEMKKAGSFYQSPYPDYYATNAMFLKAKQILICPAPMVTIGITPKSFGAYYFGGREAEGVEFLKNVTPKDSERLSQVVLPGLQHNTSWLASVETIKKNFGAEAEGLDISYERYRFLQIWHIYTEHYLARKIPKTRLTELRRLLTSREKVIGLGLSLLVRFIKAFRLDKETKLVNRLIKMIGQYPAGTLRMLRVEDNHMNILEVFEKESASKGSVGTPARLSPPVSCSPQS